MARSIVAGSRVDHLDLFTLLELDPGLAECRRDLDGRLMIDEIAVDHGLAVGILEDGFPKMLTVCSAGVAVSPIFTASKYSSTRRYFEM